jgi:hypothetical protein
MNNKVKFVMITCNGIMVNVTASQKTMVGLTTTGKSILYGFYDDDIASNINYGNRLFVYGRRWIDNKNGKLNAFELPQPKTPYTISKIYGDIFLIMYNSNNYMYEDFTKDMWDRISIKK